jgi:hypothetical protein
MVQLLRKTVWRFLKKLKIVLCMVTCAYNSNSGGGNREDSTQFEAKRLVRPSILTNKAGMATQICNSSHVGGVGRRITGLRPVLGKINLK